ncbi:Dyp-type peroxidase [Corynebacterium alimapuense]|uniref:Peroxidase n=1 Tax=Corynebacterium alimapuense TaxID=1576874 RepID=A0A3M8KBW8_9CORY|nr:Dyp-type peroxidase [Corynebacterium alimapuense]RNE50022.1 peroxidase [Corynebacterium alimapuense]
MTQQFSRRKFFAGAGLFSTVATAGALSACAKPETSDASSEAAQSGIELATETIAFDQPHQAGIHTKHQAHQWLIAFNLAEDADRDGVIRLMKLWTDDARKLTQGEIPLGSLDEEMVTRPANLTATIGYGRGFLVKAGLEDHAPVWLDKLPEYPTDELLPEWSEGDICLQIAADDPVAVSYASRWMIKAAKRYATPAWVQEGFSYADGVLAESETPRNLFGQKDGTVNLRTEEELDSLVWISDSENWLNGGTSLVVRRIEMDMDGWDAADRGVRELSMGRTIAEGAPLGQEKEFDDVDLTVTDSYGLPAIDSKSHVARAHPPVDNPEQQILRRVYNYDLPPIPGHRFTSNSGLVFGSFQQDPLTQFHPIQQRLAEADRLNEWIFHTGSAVFAIPRGTAPDEYWGQSLLET